MVSQFNPASAYSNAYPASAMTYGNTANLSINSLYHTQMFASGYGQINGSANSLTLGPSLSYGPIFSNGPQVSGYSLPPQAYGNYQPAPAGSSYPGVSAYANAASSYPSVSAFANGASPYPQGSGLMSAFNSPAYATGIPNATSYGNTPSGSPTAYQPYDQTSYGMGNALAYGAQPPIYANEQPQSYESLPRGIAQTFNHIGFDAFGRMIGNLYDMASNGLNQFAYRNRTVGPVDPSSLTSYGYVANPGMVAYVSGVGPGSYANVTKSGTQAYGGAQAWLFDPASGVLQDYSGPPRS